MKANLHALRPDVDLACRHRARRSSCRLLADALDLAVVAEACRETDAPPLAQSSECQVPPRRSILPMYHGDATAAKTSRTPSFCG
eukprot:8999025-Pyramimonas_sp.AAC.1